MFRVMYWKQQYPQGCFPKTDEEHTSIQTHSTHDTLKEAKKVCRSLGHIGEDDPMWKGYPPVAYVANPDLEVCYIPRFKKIT